MSLQEDAQVARIMAERACMETVHEITPNTHKIIEKLDELIAIQKGRLPLKDDAISNWSPEIRGKWLTSFALALRQGMKIEAIKGCRMLTDLGMKEAKDLVEELEKAI